MAEHGTKKRRDFWKLIRRRKFLLTIVLSFLLVWCIPVVTLVTGNVSNITAVEQSIAETYRSMLAQFARAIDSKLGYVRNVMLQISSNAKLSSLLSKKGMLTAEERYDMNQIIRSNASYIISDALISEVYIYVNQSRIVLTSTTLYAQDLFDVTVEAFDGMKPSEWFASACAESMVYDEIRSVRVMKGGMERESIFCIQSLPLSYGSSVNGLIVIELDKNRIAAAASDTGSQFDAFMFNIDGQMLFGSNDDEAILNSARQVSVQGSKMDAVDGETYTQILLNEDIYDLRYVAVAPMPKYLEQVTRLQRNLTLQLLICFIASMILIAMLTCRNYRSIRTIMQQASRVAKGNNNAGFSELEYISNSFDLAILQQEQLRRQLDDTVQDKRKTDRMLRDNQRAMYDNLITALVIGNVERYDDPDSIMRHFNINLPWDGFYSIQMIAYQKNPAGNVDMEALLDTLSRACEWMQEMLSSDNAICYAIPVEKRMAAMLVNFPRDHSENIEQRICSACKALANEMSESSGYCIAVGLSNAMDGLVDVDIAHQQAQSALEHGLILSCQNVFLYREIHSSDKKYYYPIEMEQRLMDLMLSGDLKNARSLLSQLYEENLIRRALPPQMAYYAFMDIACTLTKAIGMLNADVGYIDADNQAIMSRLSACRRTEEFRYEIDCLVENICTLANRSKGDKQKKLKKMITEYIDENYTNISMSQQSVAEVMDISASYLSKYFKQEFHENMLSYVNRKRIVLAKKLLGTTDLLLEDIAARTGFGSSKTLIRVFKQYEGITPGHYRSMALEESSNEQ